MTSETPEQWPPLTLERLREIVSQFTFAPDLRNVRWEFRRTDVIPDEGTVMVFDPNVSLSSCIHPLPGEEPEPLQIRARVELSVDLQREAVIQFIEKERAISPTPEPQHVCGLQGFGRGRDGIHDVCPACSSSREAPTDEEL